MSTRKRQLIRTTRRCDNMEPPAGTLLKRTKADALTFRIDDVQHDEPIYVTTVPTAWRVNVLVDGVERWTEVAGPTGDIWRAVDRLIDGEGNPS